MRYSLDYGEIKPFVARIIPVERGTFEYLKNYIQETLDTEAKYATEAEYQMGEFGWSATEVGLANA